MGIDGVGKRDKPLETGMRNLNSCSMLVNVMAYPAASLALAINE